jgi:hypothetical protein
LKNLIDLEFGEGFQENSKYKSILNRQSYLPAKGEPITELEGDSQVKLYTRR